jgi:hypothetical protein
MRKKNTFRDEVAVTAKMEAQNEKKIIIIKHH